MAEYDSAFAHNPFGHNPDGIWANRIMAESDYGRIGLCAKTLNWVWLIVGLNCDLACPCTICNCSWILRIMCEMSIKAKIYRCCSGKNRNLQCYFNESFLFLPQQQRYIVRCLIVSFNVENCIACALFFFLFGSAPRACGDLSPCAFSRPTFLTCYVLFHWVKINKSNRRYKSINYNTIMIICYVYRARTK